MKFISLMSRGLDCPFCKHSFGFSHLDSASIRLYACCRDCAIQMKIKINEDTIEKNKQIWLKMEKSCVFGDDYSGA